MNGLRQAFRRPAVRACLSLLMVIALGAVFNADGAFFSWGTHRDMLRQVSVIGILACGMTVVIIAGGIDLSVGSGMGLAAGLFSLLTIHAGWNPVFGAAATLLAGVCCGAISGFLTGRFRIQPFISTLAMMVFARGMAKWISGGQKVSPALQMNDGSYTYVPVPPVFDILSARIAGGHIAVVTLVLAGCLLLCGLFLSRIRWGRHMYALGGNEDAARYAGLPVRATTVLAYAISGILCGVAGICQAAQELQGDPEAGSTYELSAIAMVVIGGTSLRGGEGTVWLTALGILIIGYLEKILSINAVGEETRLMLTGAIIVAAVLFQKKR